MNDLRLVAQQVRYEQKSYWRNPAAAFFTFAFPLMFFFILVSIAGGNVDAEDLGPGVKLSQYYTPSILGYAVMSACFLQIALGLARLRDSGVLKRFRGTPLPAWVYVAGIIGNSIIVTSLLSAVCILFARLVYGVHFHAGDVPALIVTIAIAAIVFCALGIAVSSIVPNADAAPPIVNLPYFILVFISGTYFPVSGNLGKIAGYFPLRPFITAMYRVFDPLRQGGVWAGHDLLVLASWGAGATVFAARHFSWAPRR